ncbi:MAG TPA: hypothetical protein DEP28_02125 [Bacteroidetes bacterium]|nr:hypothetical protein [Bacteroidota bacterium]HCN36820.1 hypothetical protein [Bacteroidota bacterium]
MKMEITGKITGIKYKLILSDELKEIELNKFDINTAPPTCLLKNEKNIFAISKWVSPKRTRSYPFERVYNSLKINKKITVIPIIKDEGAKGDRDFIQWDTVSLMSLLDVFVIFAYYEKADVNPKNKNKISNQKFDNKYVNSKVKEIEQYHSSALHWNLNELKTNLHFVIDKTKTSYNSIEKQTKVKLHKFSGIDSFKEKIGKDVSLFMDFSRGKAKMAQAREFLTTQPKESLSSLSKSKISILNYLGGQYFLTVDEIEISNNKISLIEGKHSKDNLIPSKSDIKDGLIKMILYCNLKNISVNGKRMRCEPVLCLTSTKLKGSVTSKNNLNEIKKYFEKNKLSPLQIALINEVIKESKANKFTLKLKYSK